MYASKLKFKSSVPGSSVDSLVFCFLSPIMRNMDTDPPADDQNNGQQQGKHDHKQGNRKRQGDAAERDTRDPTVAAWARWVNGLITSFMGKSGHTENIAEMTLSLEEDITEQEIPYGALEALALRSGLDLSKEDLLTAVVVQRKRKGLQPHLVKGCFVQWKAENNQAAEAEQAKEADTNNAVDMSGQQPAAFHDLVATLAAAEVENEAPRQEPGARSDNRFTESHNGRTATARLDV